MRARPWSPVDPGGGAGRRCPGGWRSSSGLGSSLLTARASASLRLRQRMSVFHASLSSIFCLFIPPLEHFLNFLSTDFCCFVILPHSLTSLLPLPRGSSCPQPRVPCPLPAAPFCFTLRPPPPPEAASSGLPPRFSGGLCFPGAGVLVFWIFLRIAGFLKCMSRQSRTKGVWKTGAEDVLARGNGLARLMPGCGWWGPGALGQLRAHELCGPPADSVNTKCQVLCPKQFIPSQEESCPSLLAWEMKTCLG